MVQILGHDSHNKYSFQATDQVRNFMLTLLITAIVNSQHGHGQTRSNLKSKFLKLSNTLVRA